VSALGGWLTGYDIDDYPRTTWRAYMSAREKEPLNGQVLPLGGGSANGSGGPPPTERPGCGYCGDDVVRQDDGRTFHLDGSPACRNRTDPYARKPVGWQPPGEEATR
jgi:hypothetical protein